MIRNGRATLELLTLEKKELTQEFSISLLYAN